MSSDALNTTAAPREAAPHFRSNATEIDIVRARSEKQQFEPPAPKRYFQLKYICDRIVGSVLLVGFAPLIACLWLAVKLTSKGPGFYSQTRVGLNGKLFKVVKLRTMRVDAEAGGRFQWCIHGDPRVTWLGKLLRKVHLDELPQLWNVALGQMCLVGPRPERPEITKSLALIIPQYHLRNSVKPGVTGLAQVNLEPDTNINITRQKQILDLRYIARAGLFLDLRMLGATALRMLFIKGANAMSLMGLYETISHEELVAIGYQFDTPEEELWNPSKGIPAAPAATQERSDSRISNRLAELVPPAKAAPQAVPNAFTVDVEDYFHVAAFEHRVSRKHWDTYECRVEINTDRMLRLLEQHNVTGTFFVLGWVADRYPKLIQRIHQAGHELGSHGYWHHLVYDQTPEDFATDLIESRIAIAEACGVEVTAYRAPCFSIVIRSLWALDILAEKGFTTDSSIFPIRGHDKYGIPNAKQEIHEITTDYGPLIEFPASAWHVGKLNIPIGGGYFRMAPYALALKAQAEVRKRGRPAMFYTHPWEIDPKQPRVKGAGFKSNVRHYTGLRTNYARMNHLLADMPFASMQQVIRAVMPKETASLPPVPHFAPERLVAR